MEVYFTFDSSMLYDKKLEKEMIRHMRAAHMKNDIKTAIGYLKMLREYKISTTSYPDIQIRKCGPYFKDGDKYERIIFLKAI